MNQQPLNAAEFQNTTLLRSDGRSVPIKISSNWSSGCLPTVILSHGMGGSEDGLGYVAEASVGAGYRVLTMGHVESDPKTLRKVFLSQDKSSILSDKALWDARAKDMDAAIAYAKKNNCNPFPFVLGGHSMGAALTMIEAGAKGSLPFQGKNRFDAYMALSPQGTGWAFSSLDAWQSVFNPMLMVTGTKDSGFDGDYKKLLEAWDGLASGQKRLAIIDGATHMSVGGRGKPTIQRQSAKIIIEYLSHIKNGWQKSIFYGDETLVIKEK